MPRHVRISSGTVVAMPNGQVYASGDTAFLTDDQFAQLRPSILDTVVQDLGSVGGGGANQTVLLSDLPTVNPHISGALWNNGGTPTVSSG